MLFVKLAVFVLTTRWCSYNCELFLEAFGLFLEIGAGEKCICKEFGEGVRCVSFGWIWFLRERWRYRGFVFRRDTDGFTR